MFGIQKKVQSIKDLTIIPVNVLKMFQFNCAVPSIQLYNCMLLTLSTFTTSSVDFLGVDAVFLALYFSDTDAVVDLKLAYGVEEECVESPAV